MPDDGSPKIYLLPNLMTAGNLFCGFLATLKILHGTLEVKTAQVMANGAAHAASQLSPLDAGNHDFKTAIWCILAACIFDLLDGRLARLGGTDSPFGREFDSLADIVSFGVAPALLVSRVVLRELDQIGWLVASVYLICGAMRLARFNCIAASGVPGADKDFKGFPIPAAAGLVASITLFMLWLNNDRLEHSLTKWVLPPLLLVLSWMMFSGFRYPELQGDQLAHHAHHPEVHRHRLRDQPHGDVLPMDARGDLHHVSALRLPAPVPLAEDQGGHRG